jgi:hypothetical protein
MQTLASVSNHKEVSVHSIDKISVEQGLSPSLKNNVFSLTEIFRYLFAVLKFHIPALPIYGAFPYAHPAFQLASSSELDLPRKKGPGSVR